MHGTVVRLTPRTRQNLDSVIEAADRVVGLFEFLDGALDEKTKSALPVLFGTAATPAGMAPLGALFLVASGAYRVWAARKQGATEQEREELTKNLFDCLEKCLPQLVDGVTQLHLDHAKTHELLEALERSQRATAAAVMSAQRPVEVFQDAGHALLYFQRLRKDNPKLARWLLDGTTQEYSRHPDTYGGRVGDWEQFRTALDRLEDLQTQVEALSRSMDGAGELPIKVEEESEGSGIGWLRYYSRATRELVGRDEDFAFLREFRDQDDGFLWTMITGSGGAGKTRLAWEFIHETLAANALENAERWYAGFVDTRKPPEGFHRWHPDRNVLLIYDYAESRADAVVEVIDELRKGSRKKKRRVLLLDRSFSRDDQLGKALLGGDDSDKRIGAYYSREELYRGIQPRVLKPLSPPQMAWVFESAFHTIAGYSPKRTDVAAAVELFDSRWSPRDCHPIYATGLATLCVESDIPVDISVLRKQVLLDYLLDRMERHWEKLVPAPKSVERDQVFVSTVLRGLQVESARSTPSLAPTRFELAQRMVGEDPGKQRGISLGIFPDLLGEAYVAERLAGNRGSGVDQDLVKDSSLVLLKWAIQLSPNQSGGRDNFLALLVADFLEREDVRSMFVSHFLSMSQLVQNAVLRNIPAVEESTAQLLFDLCKSNGLGHLLEQFSVAPTSSLGVSRTSNPDQLAAKLSSGIQLARHLNNRNQLADAIGHLSSLVKEIQKEVGNWPSDLLVLRELAVALGELGDAQKRMGQFALALSNLGSAASAFEGILEARPAPDSQNYNDASISLWKLGSLLAEMEDFNGAALRLKRALRLSESALELSPESHHVQHGYATVLLSLADVLLVTGNRVKGMQYLKSSLELRERLVAASVGDAKLQALRSCTVAQERMGRQLEADGDIFGAKRVFAELLESRKILASRPNSGPQALFDLITALIWDGEQELNLGQLVEAEIRFREASKRSLELLNIFGEQPPPDFRRVRIVTLSRIGDCLFRQGDQKASTFLRRAIELGEALVQEHPDVPRYQDDLVRYRMLLRECPN